MGDTINSLSKEGTYIWFKFVTDNIYKINSQAKSSASIKGGKQLVQKLTLMYLTSGNSRKIASSAAALAFSILDGDDGDAPKQETCTNLMIPPCSLAICTYKR